MSQCKPIDLIENTYANNPTAIKEIVNLQYHIFPKYKQHMNAIYKSENKIGTNEEQNSKPWTIENILECHTAGNPIPSDEAARSETMRTWFEKQFTYKDEVTLLNLLNKRKYTCTYCNDKFYNLKRHIRSSHTGEKIYLCEICGEQFMHHISFRKHKNHHLSKEERLENRKKFSCVLCKKKYKKEFWLKRHMERWCKKK